MMKIFISGASGLVGGNAHDYFTTMNCYVLGTHLSYPLPHTQYYNTLEPNHPMNVDIDAFAPEVIVHCGALTHVDYCEQEVEESYSKTVISTKNLVALAKKYHARFVYISTDYVFDGQRGMYTEEDQVNPLSIYAKHKLEAEQYVMNEMGGAALVLRITNVYGDEARHKNFVARIIQQCKAGDPIVLKLPYDQYATPVNAYDVARAMYLLLRDGHSGIYHIASTDWMNRVELAKRVLSYFPGKEYHLEALSTLALKQPAKRPLKGGLHAGKFSALYPTFEFSNIDDYVKKVTLY